MRLRPITAASMALVVGIGLLGIVGASADVRGPSVRPFDHVFYIMMENQGTDVIVGSPQAPYINSLIKQYGYEDNYFGVTHVSLPNYVAAISGNNWYTNSDDPTQTFDHTNLISQLDAHNISWKAYMESMPYAGYTGNWYPDNLPAGTAASVTPPNALYAKKHNPFALFTNIPQSELRQNVVPLQALQTDLQSGRVPKFVWITPNVINDMHGQPPGQGATVTFNDPSQLVQAGDSFLSQYVHMIMTSKAWTGNSVIFITWDEAEFPGSNPTAQQLQQFTAPGPDSPVLPAGQGAGFTWQGGAFGGGQVPMIVIAKEGPHPITVNAWADHYSILRTIEQSWNLGYLGMAADSEQVTSLWQFFHP